MIIDDIRKGQKGDDQAVLALISKFSPALKKYARKLGTEDAYYDLQADFLELVFHFDCEKQRETSDGAIVQYLSQSIYHAYIKLLRQLIDNKVPTMSVDELIDSILDPNAEVYEMNEIQIDIPPTLLTHQEAEAFFQICIAGYSAAEIARRMRISRQSINQAKRRAISKLQQFFRD